MVKVPKSWSPARKKRLEDKIAKGKAEIAGANKRNEERRAKKKEVKTPITPPSTPSQAKEVIVSPTAAAQTPTAVTPQIQPPLNKQTPLEVTPAAEPKRSLLQDFLGFQQLSKGIATPENVKGGIGGLARGAGVSLAGGVIAAATMIIGSAAASGATLLATKGLSNPKVASAAAGRLAAATKYISKTYPKTPITTKVAKQTLSYIGKLTTGKKFGGALTGLIGGAVLNGFLEEEADQTISFAIDQATRNEDLDRAAELIEFRKDLTNKDMWENLRLLIPLEGVWKYMQAARLKLEQQQRTLEKTQKTLTEGYEPTGIEQAKRKEEDEYWAKIRGENK